MPSRASAPTSRESARPAGGTHRRARCAGACLGITDVLSLLRALRGTADAGRGSGQSAFKCSGRPSWPPAAGDGDHVGGRRRGRASKAGCADREPARAANRAACVRCGVGARCWSRVFGSPRCARTAAGSRGDAAAAGSGRRQIVAGHRFRRRSRCGRLGWISTPPVGAKARAGLAHRSQYPQLRHGAAARAAELRHPSRSLRRRHDRSMAEHRHS